MKHPSRPFLNAMSSFESALCSLCCLLFKTILSHSSLCALGVILWQSSLAEVHYVDLNSTNATPPYTNWATAATNIQDAVDAAAPSDEIVVTNGIYTAGGRIDPNGGGARVVVDKPLSLRSLNGPQFTTIAGGSGFPWFRCVSLTDNATLSGFTLTNGVSSGLDGGGGGGVWCAASNAVVSDCVISGNQAWTYYYDAYGGGAYGGTLNNCTLIGNSARYVQSDYVTGTIYVLGGGAAYCALNHCTVSENLAAVAGLCSCSANDAEAEGGGAYSCTLNNCTLIRNSASATNGDSGVYALGGGAAYCTLNNCTVTGNSAAGHYGPVNNGGGGVVYEGGSFGGGVHGCRSDNCILYYNSPENFNAYDPLTPTYCCTTPNAVVRTGNITNAPLFVDTNGWANLRLQSNSSCINAGFGYAVGDTDLDGNPRIIGGTVDIGAYEFQSPVSKISYAWLQQYGLPINAATDTADPDGDAVDNYHEWLAGTNPTNALSSPAKLTITPSSAPPSGIILTWSTNTVGFTLQSTTNPFSPAAWVTNSPAPVIVAGQNTVTNPATGAPRFYRLIH